ncbi:NAD(P)-binding protein [Annulohypoxylon moriforme]|uniref:Short chain dehydrogenase/reductase mfmJ n=1 Tax=Annulohypoxylon moriforme TaxID=326622 RepID=MFMJ_ANNMO|nr:NAD(P)-binding protein [Annulohypoxylon moriforme]
MVSSKELPPSTVPFFPNQFFRNQFRSKPQYPPPNTNLSEKVAIISGGNTGLGFEAATQLLSFKLGTLILAVRSTAKGEAAASKLRARYPKATIHVWKLDMSSYDSIQEFAGRVNTQLPRLDMVILNAGVSKLEFGTVSSTGHEETVQINYLSTALLAILLLPALKSKSPPGIPGRLTIVSAALTLVAKFPNRDESPLLPSFDNPKYWDPNDQYCSSKLLMHLFLWKLVDYISADDVIVNLADPGFVKGTELARDVSGGQRVGLSIFASLTGRNKKHGASTYVDAVVNKGKESHGGFIMSWQIHPYPTLLYTSEGQQITERLWDETLAEFEFANVRGIIESMKGN